MIAVVQGDVSLKPLMSKYPKHKYCVKMLMIVISKALNSAVDRNILLC